MKVKKIYVIILLYSVASGWITPDLSPGQTTATIKNISHFPLNPGDELTISVALSSIPNNFDNVTLIYKVNDEQWTRVLMDSSGGIQFQSTLRNLDAGDVVSYYAELYYSNVLQDRAPDVGTVDVTIGGIGGKGIVVKPGVPTEIGRGNYTISDENASIFVNITLNSAISLNLTITPKTQGPTIRDFELISDVFTIEVNDTDAVDSALLVIPYNPDFTNSLGALESRLELLTRETSDDQWSPYTARVDVDNNQVLANVTHFSDWTVVTKSAALRILDLEYSPQIPVQSREDIVITASNVGNELAHNVTMRIFLPEGLLINNQSEVINITKLMPLENISITWEFFADKRGVYTIVVVVDGENADDDITEIQIEVVNEIVDSAESTLPMSSREEVPYYLSSSIIILAPISLRKNRKGEIK